MITENSSALQPFLLCGMSTRTNLDRHVGVIVLHGLVGQTLTDSGYKNTVKLGENLLFDGARRGQTRRRTDFWYIPKSRKFNMEQEYLVLYLWGMWSVFAATKCEVNYLEVFNANQ